MFLVAPFSSDEIKRSVWDCGTEKASGPDGFTFGFLKRYWEFMKEDIFSMVSHFFEAAEIPIGCNSLFITLIPNVVDPKSVTDFRPISLIGC